MLRGSGRDRRICRRRGHADAPELRSRVPLHGGCARPRPVAASASRRRDDGLRSGAHRWLVYAASRRPPRERRTGVRGADRRPRRPHGAVRPDPDPGVLFHRRGRALREPLLAASDRCRPGSDGLEPAPGQPESRRRALLGRGGHRGGGVGDTCAHRAAFLELPSRPTPRSRCQRDSFRAREAAHTTTLRAHARGPLHHQPAAARARFDGSRRRAPSARGAPRRRRVHRRRGCDRRRRARVRRATARRGVLPRTPGRPGAQHADRRPRAVRGPAADGPGRAAMGTSSAPLDVRTPSAAERDVSAVRSRRPYHRVGDRRLGKQRPGRATANRTSGGTR